MRPLWNEKSVENGYGADMEWIWRNILKMKWSGVDLDYGWELGAEMEPKFGSVKTSSVMKNAESGRGLNQTCQNKNSFFLKNVKISPIFERLFVVFF